MKPPLVGRALVCLSTIDWDFLWQGHQEIMSRIARSGDPVLFIDNPGVRTPTFSDAGRLAHRLANWWKGVRGFRQERPNLVVLSPLLLPFPYARWARKINAWLISRAITAWAKAVRCDTPVLWTFLPTPLSADVIEALDPPASVYYCVDNFQASSEEAKQSAASEAKLFRKADIVFVTSHELQRKALRHRRQAHVFPFAVDFEKFEACRELGRREPEDLAAIPRPRCGYVGGVHRWIDFDLLRQAAVRNPAVSFVLVGPLQTDVSALEGLPNVHLMGSRSHDGLPDYIGSFDMGIIPYKKAAYTDNVYPTKLNEYLAMGIPVLSTDLPEVRKFNEDYDGLVAVARDAAGFAEAVARLSADPDPGRRGERIEAARGNGWEARVDEMTALVRARVAEPPAAARSWADIVRRLSGMVGYRGAAVVAACLLATAVLRLTPLVWWLAEPLRVAGKPAPADAVVVLAGGVGESHAAAQAQEERVNEAIALYRQGYAPRLLLCSNYVRTFRETTVMRAIAIEEGLPAGAIQVEEPGEGTRQMIRAAGSRARQNGWKRVLLVSSPYHMRRALMAWRKIVQDIEVVPMPARRSRFYGYSELNGRVVHQGGPTIEQMRGIVHEYAAMIYYRISPEF